MAFVLHYVSDTDDRQNQPVEVNTLQEKEPRAQLFEMASAKKMEVCLTLPTYTDEPTVICGQN